MAYRSAILFSLTLLAGLVVQCKGLAQTDALDQGWAAYRNRDFETAEHIYLDQLDKSGDGISDRKKAILERLAALYFAMTLPVEKISQTILTHGTANDQSYLLHQMILRYGKYDPRSMQARVLLNLPEPPPEPVPVTNPKPSKAIPERNLVKRSPKFFKSENATSRNQNDRSDRWQQYKLFVISNIQEPASSEAVAQTKSVWKQIGMGYWPNVHPLYGWTRGPRQPFERLAQEVANSNGISVKEVIGMMEEKFLIESNQGKLFTTSENIDRDRWIGREVALEPHPYLRAPVFVMLRKDGDDPDQAARIEVRAVR